MNIQHISGVVLAGGKSRRMGQDKRHLLLNGQTLFQRAKGVLESVFSEVLVVVADHETSLPVGKCTVVTDLIPNCATAGGLFTGLSCSTQGMVFVVACDMPYLHSEVITFMASQVEGYDIILAKLSTGVQPLHGFYRKSCLPLLEDMIHHHDLKVQHLLEQPGLRVKLIDEASLQKIDPHLLTFMNINTPADLEMARKLSS